MHIYDGDTGCDVPEGDVSEELDQNGVANPMRRAAVGEEIATLRLGADELDFAAWEADRY